MVSIFCFLAFTLLLFSFSVAICVNPVASIFSLIGVFIITSCLMIIIGVEFYAFILLIIYVGAVVILFLFLIMLSNAKDRMSKSFTSILFFSIPILLLLQKFLNIFHVTKRCKFTTLEISTAHIGYTMFIKYFLPLQLVGILLLLSMCATVVLALERIKNKNYFITTDTKNVVLIDQKFGDGVDTEY